MLFKIFLRILVAVALFRLSFPVFPFPVCAFGTLVPLLQIANMADLGKLKRVYSWFWIWVGLVLMNVSVLYWSFVDTPIGSAILCAGNGFCMAVPFVLFSLSQNRLQAWAGKVGVYAFFGVFWVGVESLRFYGDFAFPWLTLGNCFATLPALVQWYSYTGVLGGSLWIVSLNILLFLWIEKMLSRQPKVLLGYFLVLLLPVGISLCIFYQKDESKSMEVLILHPCMKRYGASAVTHLQQVEAYLKLIESNISPKTDYVILPETALQNKNWTHLLHRHFPTQNFRRLLKKYPHTHLIVGTITAEYTPKHLEATQEVGTERFYKTYNNLMQITKDSLLQMRSKHKLVPYEERRPYYLRWFDGIYFYLGGEDWNYTYPDYAQPNTFKNRHNSKNILPLICYEAVFYEFASQKIDTQTMFITCSANEIWYTQTEGAEQAYALCKLLAVCTGKSVARSSDFGVSAWIDAKGTTIAKVGSKKPTALKAKIQTSEHLSFFAKYGDWVGKLCVLFSVMALIYVLYQSIKKAKRFAMPL